MSHEHLPGDRFRSSVLSWPVLNNDNYQVPAMDMNVGNAVKNFGSFAPQQGYAMQAFCRPGACSRVYVLKDDRSKNKVCSLVIH